VGGDDQPALKGGDGAHDGEGVGAFDGSDGARGDGEGGQRGGIDCLIGRCGVGGSGGIDGAEVVGLGGFVVAGSHEGGGSEGKAAGS